MAGAGIRRKLIADTGVAMEQLQQFLDEKKTWLFGHLSYDLKKELDGLSSAHPDLIQFPVLFFFEPEIVIRLNENEMTIDADEPAEIFEAILSQAPVQAIVKGKAPLVKNRIQKEEYLSTVRQLQKHILRGDCYEINFCQEFFAEEAVINPVKVYQQIGRAHV